MSRQIGSVRKNMYQLRIFFTFLSFFILQNRYFSIRFSYKEKQMTLMEAILKRNDICISTMISQFILIELSHFHVNLASLSNLLTMSDPNFSGSLGQRQPNIFRHLGTTSRRKDLGTCYQTFLDNDKSLLSCIDRHTRSEKPSAKQLDRGREDWLQQGAKMQGSLLPPWVVVQTVSRA